MSGGEMISGVAVLTDDGRLWSLPRPHRHSHIFALAAFVGDDAEPCVQGFTTTAGRFVGRTEGLSIAKAAGQLKQKHGNLNMLFSEDMW